MRPLIEGAEGITNTLTRLSIDREGYESRDRVPRARFACPRLKPPQRVPRKVPLRRRSAELPNVARVFRSILDESGRSAAWLAHLPWVKSRPNRGRLFRVIPRIPQRIRTLRNT